LVLAEYSGVILVLSVLALLGFLYMVSFILYCINPPLGSLEHWQLGNWAIGQLGNWAIGQLGRGGIIKNINLFR